MSPFRLSSSPSPCQARAAYHPHLAAIMPLDASFKSALQAAEVHEKIIEFLEKPMFKLTNHASFANFLLNRGEVQSMILDQIGDEELKKNIGQRGLLVKFWREAEAMEALRLERKVKGVAPDDLEDPLPDGEHAGDLQRFTQAGVQWEPALSEQLCEPLYGRLKREALRAKQHTVLPLERVRSAAEVPRTAVGKILGMAPGIDMKVAQHPMPTGPRPGGVRDHYLLVWLVQVLFLGGWAVLGRVILRGEGPDRVPFASFHQCWTYLRFIRERVTPMKGPFPDLARCIRCENDTRLLWASAMSKGQTLDEAMASCAPQQSAIWLWTTETDNRNIPDVPSLPQDLPAPRSPSPRQRAQRQQRSRSRQPRQAPAPYVADSLTTRSGKRICQEFNNSAHGCGDTSKCKNGDLHICNFVANGRLCGRQNMRRCLHHPTLTAAGSRDAQPKGDSGGRGGQKERERDRRSDRPRDTGGPRQQGKGQSRR